MRDMHSKLKVKRAISPVALGTTGTGKTGVVIDRQGYNSLEYVFGVGSITATNATVTPVIKECSTSNGVFTSVADSDLLGTESANAIPAAATRTSGVSKNVTKSIGYRGNKRYTTISLINTASAGIIGHADAILSDPNIAPVS